MGYPSDGAMSFVVILQARTLSPGSTRLFNFGKPLHDKRFLFVSAVDIGETSFPEFGMFD